ncbi:hypothetical protein [Klenkia brasiliensis]|uniref:Uncharacterized protein n=1 Tax=Klenkia brasiliensis TaxID=333142 RepID=A0A1G7TK49_9ACTN|nr:hypothetical protein [Klenkia brasiliensis]SDG35707.1 hypothetical protein SAMN05660324_2512 [Klenkia brasiliensis]
MTSDIQLISDGDGLAIIGEPSAIRRFVADEGLSARELELSRLGGVLSAGGALVQAGATLAENSGRWVKLTPESAQLVKKYGLMNSKTPGVSHAMIGQPGSITNWLQIDGGVGALASNPALLTGAAGIMTQLAMQQAMDEITDYLAKIDAKLDDVLRAQEDAVYADLIGVGLDIDEAMVLRKQAGRVNEVTWSKVQHSSSTIARTQAYALRQLEAMAEKAERTSKIADLADTTKVAATKAEEWLGVLARTVQLQDAIAVLEIDRVLEAAPDDFDGHRIGLKVVRQQRVEGIAKVTSHLLTRMAEAARAANAKVLLNPMQSPAIVQSSGKVATAIADFHQPLAIETDRELLAARAWTEAATEFRGRVLETGADGLTASRRVGVETFDRAKSVTGRISSGIGGLRRRGQDSPPDATGD